MENILLKKMFLGARGEMICVKSLQLDLNRVLLLAVGLWPYAQSKLVKIQRILFYGILLTCIVFQFTVLITARCSPQLVIEVLSAAFFFITLAVKYNLFSFNMDNVKHLLEFLQCTYNELKDDDEIAIIKKYGTIVKRYTYVLTFLSVFGFSIFVFLPFLPRVFNIVSPVNRSRSHVSLQINMEYFINQEKYFYLILLHIYTAFCIGWIALLAAGTMVLTYWYYGCGMFQVASYRLEQAMANSSLKRSDKWCNDSLVYRRIVCAVDMHRKALTFAKRVLSTIEISYFFLMLCIVIVLSLNFFRIFEGLSSGLSYEKLTTSILFLIANYVLMFLAGYASQQVKEHSNLLFTAAYNVPWYTAPLYIQRTILFLLQRGTKSFSINLVGLIAGSLEGFTTLTSTSISYFTVIYSLEP